jgi:hypothetical protein
MKLRHAAALALAGWYLIIPPIERSGIIARETEDHWIIAARFEQKTDCERAARLMRSNGVNSSLVAHSSEYTRAEPAQKERATCIPFAPKAPAN